MPVKRCNRFARESTAKAVRAIRRSIQGDKCVDAQALLDDLASYDGHLCMKPWSRVQLASQVKGCFSRKLAARPGWRHRRYGR
jgi:hypothetical protein